MVDVGGFGRFVDFVNLFFGHFDEFFVNVHGHFFFFEKVDANLLGQVPVFVQIQKRVDAELQDVVVDVRVLACLVVHKAHASIDVFDGIDVATCRVIFGDKEQFSLGGEFGKPLGKRAFLFFDLLEEDFEPFEEHHEALFEVVDFFVLGKFKFVEFFFVILPFFEQEFLHDDFQVRLVVVHADNRCVDVEEVLQSTVDGVSSDGVNVSRSRQFENVLVVVFSRALLVRFDTARTLQPLFNGTFHVKNTAVAAPIYAFSCWAGRVSGFWAMGSLREDWKRDPSERNLMKRNYLIAISFALSIAGIVGLLFVRPDVSPQYLQMSGTIKEVRETGKVTFITFVPDDFLVVSFEDHELTRGEYTLTGRLQQYEGRVEFVVESYD